MPLGSQESSGQAQAVEVLKTLGRDRTMGLHTLALMMEDVIEEADSAAAADVMAALATKVLEAEGFAEDIPH